LDQVAQPDTKAAEEHKEDADGGYYHLDNAQAATFTCVFLRLLLTFDIDLDTLLPCINLHR